MPEGLVTERRSFGDLLRQYRQREGLSQEELAERARLSVEAVSALERGTRQRPYRPTISQLADALQLDRNEREELELSARRVPPSRPLPNASNLPLELSSFVGRENEIRTIDELLANHRFVTLVGAGGVGKTRLALRAATDFTPTGSSALDGLWFVDFSPYTDGSMVTVAIASRIGLEPRPILKPLIAFLKPKRFLLILDNCEHIIDAVAEVAGTILQECPKGQILSTSRQAFAFPGERTYRVPPLDELAAIRLFADRAEAANDAFRLTDSILSSITKICRRLDGIALAIELAAARTSALPPTTIASQLAERLLSITGGSRDPLPRHKTMQALFDWSYDLLDQTERSIFRKLSMFVGGFTLELATSLCADELGEAGVVGVLGSLVDKSLVQSDSYAEPTRYRLLEPVRQYAREKLRAYDEEDRAARNHAVALLELAERFDSRPNPPTDRDVQAHIEPERENFRAAFAWALGAIGDVAIGQRLAASGSATWVGHLTGESPRWIASALEACDEATQPRIRAKLLLRATRSTLQFGTGDKQLALEAAERALQHQLPDDVAGIAQAQFYLGWALSYWGRFDEAEKLIREALEKARSCGHQGLVADALVNLYRIRWLAGDFEEARKFNREAHALHLASGRDSLATVADDHLGEIEFALGNTEAALRLSRQVAETYRTRGDLARLSAALCNAAAYSIALDRFEDGRRYASEALALARQTATRRLLAWAMQHLAAAAILCADLEATSAVRLLGFVDQVVLQLVSSRPPTEQREYDRVLSALHGGFAEDELAKLTASGQDLSEAQAIEIAVRLSAEAPEGPS